MVNVLLWGAAAGLVHFVVIASLYANPLVDRLSTGSSRDPRSSSGHRSPGTS